MTQPQKSVCLHVGQDGQIWSVGADGNPQPYFNLSSTQTLKPGTYMVPGCSANYKLITTLHFLLMQNEVPSRILVGASGLCRRPVDNIRTILSCLATLDVHDGLMNCWHVLNGKTLSTLSLLEHYQEEGVSSLVKGVFSSHYLQAYFSFMGLDSSKLAIQLIAEIVDPRWFLNPRRPYSLSRIESYFGLKPAQFRKVCGPGLLLADDNHRRSLLLLDIVNKLEAESFVRAEVSDISNDDVRRYVMCRRVLGFVVRNWLKELKLPGYFDPAKFFKQIQVDVKSAYRQQFEG